MSSSSVTPPPSVPLPAAPATGATPVVTVSQAPAELILMPRGAVVEARVVAAPEGGQPAQLQVTVDGEPVTVAARLPLPLPVGASLALKVMPSPGGDTVNLRLAAVDGRPPLAAPDAAVFARDGASAPVTAGPLAAALPASTIGVGRPVGALVLRGDVIPDAPGGSDLLAPGTRLTLRVTQVTMPDLGRPAVASPPGGAAPATPGMPAAVPPQPGQAVAAYAAVGRIAQPPGAPAVRTPVPPFAAPGPSAPPQSAPVAPAPQAGLPFAPLPGMPPTGPHSPSHPSLAASAPQPGGGASAPPAAPAAPALGTLTGMVIGRSVLGQPTLKTDAGFVALDLRASLPVGTQVAAEVLTRVPPETGAPPPPAFVGASPLTTLDALVRSLSAVDAEAAARVIAQLPQPGPQLVANLAAAMAAVRGGDVQTWLRLSELPQRSRDEARTGRIAQRLADDLGEAGASSRRPATDWRVYPLPMFAGGQVERIQMLVRRAPESDDEEPRSRRRGDDTRFLLDFTLSHLGPMQLDGLVSRAGRSLDLVVRTHAALPEPMPCEMQGIFAAAMTGIGYAGSLSFRVTPEFVVPEATRPGDDRAGVVV